MWVLRFEPRSSARVAVAVNHWAVSPAPFSHLNLFIITLMVLCSFELTENYSSNTCRCSATLLALYWQVQGMCCVSRKDRWLHVVLHTDHLMFPSSKKKKAFNPSPIRIWGQPGLHSKSQISQDYIVRPKFFFLFVFKYFDSNSFFPFWYFKAGP